MSDYFELLNDAYWAFVLPLICVASLVSNLVSITIFNRLKAKNIVYKFMFCNCVCDSAYLICVSFVFVIRCGQFCQLKDSYSAKFYHNYIYMYLADSFSLYSSCIDIITSMQRIVFLTNRSLPKRLNVNVLLGALLVASFLLNIPNTFEFEIAAVRVYENTSNLTKITSRVIYMRRSVRTKHFAFQVYAGAYLALRSFLTFGLIFTLNYLTWYLFKQHSNKKRALKNSLLNAIVLAPPADSLECSKCIFFFILALYSFHCFKNYFFLNVEFRVLIGYPNIPMRIHLKKKCVFIFS